MCQIVVNFDPDTEFIGVKSFYTVDDVVYEEDVVFDDAEPDTVPYDSWVWIRYFGEDDHRDGWIECDTTWAPDKCIGFQVAYDLWSTFSDFSEFSLWQPRDGVHDTDSFSSTDSNTFHIGTAIYDVMVRALDEHERPDGTPPSIEIIGNHDPTLDAVAVEDHFGVKLEPEKLADAVSTYNETRSLLKKLYDLRTGDPPPFTGAEVLTVLSAGTSMPRAEYNRLLRELLEEAKPAAGGAPGSRAPIPRPSALGRVLMRILPVS